MRTGYVTTLCHGHDTRLRSGCVTGYVTVNHRVTIHKWLHCILRKLMDFPVCSVLARQPFRPLSKLTTFHNSSLSFKLFDSNVDSRQTPFTQVGHPVPTQPSTSKHSDPAAQQRVPPRVPNQPAPPRRQHQPGRRRRQDQQYQKYHQHQQYHPSTRTTRTS